MIITKYISGKQNESIYEQFTHRFFYKIIFLYSKKKKIFSYF